MALALFPLVSFLFLLPTSSVSQTVGNITVGASLFAVENSSWISPSRDFAFGFHQLEHNKDLFLLAIWYNNILEKTIVWYANGDKPAPRGSKLQLTSDQGLVLNTPQGEQLWNTQSINGVVDSGVMDDSGNFMLLGSDSILWESFKNPADTILPSQSLDKGVFLSSRHSETNFTSGKFRMVLQSDGNLVLTTINLPSDHLNEHYYDFNTAGNSDQVVFNESGYLFVLRENNTKSILTSVVTGSAKDFYYRVTLDFDGLLILYSYPKASNGDASWTTVWSQPDNICIASKVTTSSGFCGFNSICSINSGGRPICECPKGYTLLDPTDQYGSCKPNFTQTCEKEPAAVEDLYDFQVLFNVDWPEADYALLEPFTEGQCRESCLQDCMCAVAIFRSGDKCWKKKLPLSNGRFDTGLDGAKALLKVSKGDVHVPPLSPDFPNQEMKKKDQDTLILVLSLLLGSSGFVNFILVAAICLGFYFIYQKKRKSTLPQNGGVVESNLRCFSYKDLVCLLPFEGGLSSMYTEVNEF
ncbi:S-locus glycoprotein [Corchorus olitorius]|uniref:S-locus glycoprotein n=1 Tax=Corchorus olitorius TaxID=93759 RepID=A0A1R3K8S8_9ROSI|nr:S-locus glycoprotein [Corchorus olitorius]